MAHYYGDRTLYTVTEVAEMFGVSRRRIQELLERERIVGAERLAKVWVIPEGAILLEGSRISTDTGPIGAYIKRMNAQGLNAVIPPNSRLTQNTNERRLSSNVST